MSHFLLHVTANVFY